MSLYKDLFSYKKKRLYKVSKHRKDAKLNVSYDYHSNGLLPKMLSRHIQRNKILNNFIKFLDDYFLNILKGVKFLRVYKNYTVEKDDKSAR